MTTPSARLSNSAVPPGSPGGDRGDGRGRPEAAQGAAARPDRAGRDAARHRRLRGVPAHPAHRPAADHPAHRAQRRHRRGRRAWSPAPTTTCQAGAAAGCSTPGSGPCCAAASGTAPTPRPSARLVIDRTAMTVTKNGEDLQLTPDRAAAAARAEPAARAGAVPPAVAAAGVGARLPGRLAAGRRLRAAAARQGRGRAVVADADPYRARRRLPPGHARSDDAHGRCAAGQRRRGVRHWLRWTSLRLRLVAGLRARSR